MLFYKVFKKDESKKWVVLLHGLGGNSNIWYKQIKDYSNEFNVLMIDLHGHGKSKIALDKIKEHKWREITNDVIGILDELGIEKAIFIGVSLGTVVARAISCIAPERVNAMVLAGAVLRFDLKSSVLLKTAHMLKHVVPYMTLYRLFAWILMPRSNHKEARRVFVREAKKLGRDYFIFWFNLSDDVEELYQRYRTARLQIPTLLLMGKEDHIFTKIAFDEVAKDNSYELSIIEKSGHLSNIDSPEQFNKISCEYIRKIFTVDLP